MVLWPTCIIGGPIRTSAYKWVGCHGRIARPRENIILQKPKIPESMIKAKEIDLKIKNGSNNIKMWLSSHNSS